MSESIRDWNPDDGDAYQGDVCLFRLPDNITINMADEIKPRDHRLILAEGEVTGHHHAITLERPTISKAETDKMLDAVVKASRKRKATVGIARMFRDPAAADALVRAGELTTGVLAIGFLVVEGAPVVLRHDEHDAIRIPIGRYYVGAQQEWSAAEARKVMD